MGTTWDSLLTSRKFWVMVLDVIVSLVLYFGAKYLGGSTYDDIKVLVATLQPVALVLIAAIAHEDASVKGARGD